MEPTLSTAPQTPEIVPAFTSDGRVLFGCVSCKKKLSVKPTTISKTITCPHCKTGNLVPDPAALASKVVVEPLATPGAAEPAYENVLLDPAAVLASKGIEPLTPSPVSFAPVLEVSPAAPERVSFSPVTPAPAPAAADVVKKIAPSFSADGRVVFPCSNCNKKLSVKATTIGKTINCAHCQTANKVPDPAAKVEEAAGSAAAAVSLAVETPEPAMPVAVNAGQSEVVATSSPVAPTAMPAPVADTGQDVAADVAQAAGGRGKAKVDGPDRFVFTCYFCSRKMSVKLTSVGKSVKCQVCHNENIVPSPQQAKGTDVVMPTKEQWAQASQNVATGDHVEVRVFFPCYSCHKKLSAKIDQAGQPVRCPGCSTVNAVPGLSTGLISPADESGSFQVSNQLIYDAPKGAAVDAATVPAVVAPVPAVATPAPATAVSPVVVGPLVTEPEKAAVLVEEPAVAAKVEAAPAVIAAQVVPAPEVKVEVVPPPAAVEEVVPPATEDATAEALSNLAAQAPVEPAAQAVVEPVLIPEPAPLETPVVATLPQSPVVVSTSTPEPASAAAVADAPKEYVVPTEKLDEQKPLGLTDLGDPIPVGMADDEGEEVPEAFSLVVPEPEDRLSNNEPAATVTPVPEKVEIQSVPQVTGEPVAEVEIAPPVFAGGEKAKDAAAAKDDEFTLAPPSSTPAKPAAKAPIGPSISGLELGNLNKAQALAALAQMIPSASSKAAEITEDSAVLPPVNRPGMRSEVALRRSGKGGGEDISLPELKGQESTAKSERVDDAEDVFEPIAPMTLAPVAPPKPVSVEQRLSPAITPLTPVTPAATAPSAQAGEPKSASKPEKTGGGVVPAGFIAFRCQGCSKRLTVKSKHAGQEMACPVCKKMNKVPAQTPAGLMDAPPTGKTAPKAPTAAPAASAPAPAKAPKMTVESGAGGSLLGEVVDFGLAHTEEKKPAVKPVSKPAAPAAPAPAAKKPGTPTQPVKPAAAKPSAPVKPAAKAPAPKHDPNDPFAGLAHASQGDSVDMSDALSALAGGSNHGGANELDDLASALGGVSMGNADPDDITTALSMQTDQPDDGLVINPAGAVDDDAPIGLAEDPMPAKGGKPTTAYHGPPAPAPVANAGKFIPTNKNDGKLRFPCSQCGHRLKVPPEAKGKKAKCPACGTVNNVPM